MTDDKDRIAALERDNAELKNDLAALKAKVDPPKSTFKPMSDAEHRDMVHQMNERRMNLASNFHPDDLRAMEAACPTAMMKEIALRDARAPTGRPSMIPTSNQQSTSGGDPANVPGGGRGYVEPTPLGVPGGARTQELIERAVNATLPHGPEWGKGKG